MFVELDFKTWFFFRMPDDLRVSCCCTVPPDSNPACRTDKGASKWKPWRLWIIGSVASNRDGDVRWQGYVTPLRCARKVSQQNLAQVDDLKLHEKMWRYFSESKIKEHLIMSWHTMANKTWRYGPLHGVMWHYGPTTEHFIGIIHDHEIAWKVFSSGCDIGVCGILLSDTTPRNLQLRMRNKLAAGVMRATAYEV